MNNEKFIDAIKEDLATDERLYKFMESGGVMRDFWKIDSNNTETLELQKKYKQAFDKLTGKNNESK